MKSPTLCLLVVLAAAACGSAGKAQRLIDEAPVTFVDARSERPIEHVLLIPRYSATTGVSTGAGHGLGSMSYQLFVASPVIYTNGAALRVEQPDSDGILLGPILFAGRGISIDGLIVLAPGYEAAWFGELWDRRARFQVRLEPIDVNGNSGTGRALELLGKSRIRGSELTDAERASFNIIREYDIEVRFTSAERRLIERTLGKS